MSQLHTKNSFEEQQKKSYSKQVARGLALLKQAVSDNYQTTKGTVGQSIKLGLASSVGLGGLYITASKLASKVKKVSQGIKALTSFSGNSDNVEEENVFSKSEQTKQPGFFGIAGLAKYGFKHIVKSIKSRRKKEEKDKKSFFQMLVDGVKHLVKNKWFWGTLLTGVLGFGVWGLISSLSKKDDDDFDILNTEIAQNRSLVDDPDILAGAEEQQFYYEVQEILSSLPKVNQTEIQNKWQKDINNLQQSIVKPQVCSVPKPIQFISKSTPTSSTNLNKSLPVTDLSAYNKTDLTKSPLPSGSYKITSRFGYRDISAQNKHASHQHHGIDLAAKAGTPVIVPAKGKVIGSGYAPISGNWVKVQHDNGLQTVYLHLQDRNVQKGQELFGGEQLGTVGNTGAASTGAHLHYGVKKYNKDTGQYEFVNPEAYMAGTTPLNSASPAFTEEMSSNIKEDTLLTDMVAESRGQLLSLYNSFDQALVHHIKNPDEKFKKLAEKK